MLGYDTHISWLGVPQGSQKCSNENIGCVSWRENATFLILVVKITLNLVEKAVFLLILLVFKNFDTRIENLRVYITFSKLVDDFSYKHFENRSKNGQFPAFRSWKSLFYFVNEVFHPVFNFKWLQIGQFLIDFHNLCA